MQRAKDKRLTAEHRNAIEPHFDVAYYLDANPDVRKAGVDPLEHYVTWGWREGRNPSRRFDVAYYLACNSDVAAANIDPLLHYVWSGRQEGRPAIRPLSAYRFQMAAAMGPRRKSLEWGSNPRDIPPAAPDAFERIAGQRGMILSISHDDYASNTGGVQNLIGDEQRAFNLAGWSYLHLSPALPLPMLADPQSEHDFRVGIRLDGTPVGSLSVADLAEMLAGLSRHVGRIEAIVHHLMGHVPELIAQLIRASGASRTIIWTHDFFTLCPSYTLMRNDIVFCGGPTPTSPACGVCCYGDERSAHVGRMSDFFKSVQPMVMAPSQSALDLWRHDNALSHDGAVVQPLARLALAAPTLAEAFGTAGKPLRIAHIGARVFHKGWTVFEDLALRFADDPRYSFMQIGASHGPGMPGHIRQIPVQVTAENRGAMIDAIAEAGVDVAIIWSLWPETFCYVVHEALAGGAFVLARRAAGNVDPVITAAAPERGHLVDDEAGLTRLFEGDGLKTLISESPRRRGALVLGDGTFDWLRRQPGVIADVSGARNLSQMALEDPVHG